MTDLIEQIKTALDEDERIAHTAQRRAGGGDWSATSDGINADGGVVFYGATYGGTHLEDEYGQHIARHDPARVLRQVEAHRKTLDRHKRYWPWSGDPPPATPHTAQCAHCWQEGPIADLEANPVVVRSAWPCADLLDLAAACGVEQ